MRRVLFEARDNPWNYVAVEPLEFSHSQSSRAFSDCPHKRAHMPLPFHYSWKLGKPRFLQSRQCAGMDQQRFLTVRRCRLKANLLTNFDRAPGLSDQCGGGRIGVIARLPGTHPRVR